MKLPQQFQKVHAGNCWRKHKPVNAEVGKTHKKGQILFLLSNVYKHYHEVN